MDCGVCRAAGCSCNGVETVALVGLVAEEIVSVVSSGSDPRLSGDGAVRRADAFFTSTGAVCLVTYDTGKLFSYSRSSRDGFMTPKLSSMEMVETLPPITEGLGPGKACRSAHTWYKI